MPFDLAELCAPDRTAVLVMECQEGVIGAGGLGPLVEAVRRQDLVRHIGRLLTAARAAGVPVFYLTMARRADGRGSAVNCRLMAAAARRGVRLVPGSPAQAVVAALRPQASDFVVNRYHGVSPFHGTELDALLRNLSVRTVVATGVSVNVGILGLAIEAVNAGYQVVIPRDAVAGTPPEYVESVFAHTLGLLATLTTVDAVSACWGAGPRS